MSFNFPTLTPGYVGIKSDKFTLNSSFLYLYHQLYYPAYVEQQICFPQRVASYGSFQEMYRLETNAAQQKLNMIKIALPVQLFKMSSNKSAIKAGWPLVNQLNLLSCYGILEPVIHFIIPSRLPRENKIEIKLIKINAKLQKTLVLEPNCALDLNDLQKLTYKVYKNDQIAERIKMMVLKDFINYSCNYSNNIKNKKLIEKYSEQLIILLASYDQSTVQSRIMAASALRSLAVIPDDVAKQNDYLTQALILSENLKSKDDFEKILIKENLYILYQLLARRAVNKGDMIEAKKKYEAMVALNPYDSTVFSELGSLFYQKNKYSEAEHYLKVAILLGPPAASKNNYLYGKCLQNSGKTSLAIKAFYKSIKSGPHFLTSWLELLGYDQANHKNRRCKNVSKNKDCLIKRLMMTKTLVIA